MNNGTVDQWDGLTRRQFNRVEQRDTEIVKKFFHVIHAIHANQKQFTTVTAEQRNS